MSRNWIEFTEPSPAGHEELYASLRTDGRLGLGKKTLKALDDPSHVVLLLEHETGCIGVRSAPPRAVNAMRVVRSGPAAHVHAQRFVRRHDIRIDGTVRFPQAHMEDNTLVLDLHTRVSARKPKRVK